MEGKVVFLWCFLAIVYQATLRLMRFSSLKSRCIFLVNCSNNLGKWSCWHLSLPKVEGSSFLHSGFSFALLNTLKNVSVKATSSFQVMETKRSFPVSAFFLRFHFLFDEMILCRHHAWYCVCALGFLNLSKSQFFRSFSGLSTAIFVDFLRKNPYIWYVPKWSNVTIHGLAGPK